MPKIEIKGWESFKPVFESNGYTAIDEKKKLPIDEDQIKMTYLDFIEDGKSKKDAIEKTAKTHRVEVSDVEDVIKDINETEELNEAAKLFYLGRRDNPQLSKPYYKIYGQLSKADVKKKEDSAYGSMTLTGYSTKDEMEAEIAKLREDGLRVTESEDLNEGLVVIVHSDDKDETGKYLSSKGIKYSSKDDKKDVIFIIKDLGDIKPSDAKEEIETQLADKDVNANVKSMNIKESEEVNEAKKKVKAFDKVTKGDIGEDYNDEKVTIIDKAIGKKGYEKLKKYDKSGAMSDLFNSPSDYDYSEDDLKDIEMVAVKDEDGDTIVYVYDGSGVLVLESEEIEALDEKSTLEKQIKEFYKALTSDGKSHADALAEISGELDIDKKELEKVIKESEEVELNEALSDEERNCFLLLNDVTIELGKDFKLGESEAWKLIAKVATKKAKQF